MYYLTLNKLNEIIQKECICIDKYNGLFGGSESCNSFPIKNLKASLLNGGR